MEKGVELLTNYQVICACVSESSGVLIGVIIIIFGGGGCMLKYTLIIDAIGL